MFEILRVERDHEGVFYITVDGNEGWELSQELLGQLLKEIKDHIGGEFHYIASALLPSFLLEK